MSPSPRRRQVLGRLAGAIVFTRLAMRPTQLAAMPAIVAPEELRTLLPRARLRGAGVLRFFGLLVYEARLWAEPGFDAQQYARHPFALELTYARKLEGEAIAERSVAEMRRVGRFGDAQAQRWLTLMKQAFPDVVAGDRLLGFNDGQGQVRFFRNGEPTASTDDAEYARLFFGIWLAPQSSAPALRESLLGHGGQG